MNNKHAGHRSGSANPQPKHNRSMAQTMRGYIATTVTSTGRAFPQ